MIHINVYFNSKYIAKNLISIRELFERSYCNVRNLGSVISLEIFILYTRYPIVARRAWPLGRVRRASKGILHTNIHIERANKPSVLHHSTLEFRGFSKR